MGHADNRKTGKVWLVGAGPSDPGLFTLRGRQVLQCADVVLCDALVGPGITAMIPEHAERVYVGKCSGNHAMPQDEINRLLVSYALDGKCVVRLKGGDPFLFGRGGEELELLAEHGIPFEVVPGVTSALSVPAYQGIPVTHRGISSSIHVVTGHFREGSVGHIDFDALVRCGGTLLFLMGVSSLEDICRGLLDAGMDPNVPAALLMRGTTARQERVLASVGTLSREAVKRGAKPPAVIVVGAVCALSERFSWYEKLPLGGVRVLLTRPPELIGGMSEKLRDLGAEVWEMPAIRTVRREHNNALREALHRIEQYQWIVFTSPAGVRIFFEELYDRRLDVRRLGGIRIAVMGKGTGKALEKHGMYPDVMPDIYDGEHLGKAIAKAGRPGERVLIPRASAGNRELTDAISHMEIDDIPTYDTVYAESDDAGAFCAELTDGGIDYVVFSSASCVRGLASALGYAAAVSAHAGDECTEDFRDTETVRNAFSGVKAVCIGRQTAQAAEALGMRVYVAERADEDSLIECLLCVESKTLQG